MSKYLIVIEKTGPGFSTYSPDLDGCVSTGNTRDEVEGNMKEASEFHLDGRREAVTDTHLTLPTKRSVESW